MIKQTKLKDYDEEFDLFKIDKTNLKISEHYFKYTDTRFKKPRQF